MSSYEDDRKLTDRKLIVDCVKKCMTEIAFPESVTISFSDPVSLSEEEEPGVGFEPLELCVNLNRLPANPEKRLALFARYGRPCYENPDGSWTCP